MPRLSYSKREAIRQAVALQRYCVKGAELIAKDLSTAADGDERARAAAGLGNLVKGFTSLEATKRVLKGDPLPGSFRPEKPKRKAWGGGHPAYEEPDGTN